MSIFPGRPALRRVCAFGGIALFLAGCALPRENPSMPVTSKEARVALAQMASQPQTLPRPLVVVSGFNDLGLPSQYLAPRLARIFPGRRIVPVSFLGCHTFDACADRLISAVQARFPSSVPNETVEVDVVAVSMGGLVSRYAAVPRPGQRYLRITRLFTISTPHRGADLAGLPAFEAVQVDMRFGSPFLRTLNQQTRNYPIYPYVRLGDVIVGAKNSAPFGTNPWWLPPDDVSPAHGFAYSDDRILLDIALRLRNEKPVSTYPPAPLPLAARLRPN